MKKILKALILVAIITLTGCSTNKYDDKLVESGAQAIEDFGVVPGRTYEVTLEKGIYVANINGNIQKVQMGSEKEEKLSITEIEETNKEIDSIAQKAKNKIVKYIKASKILKDKDSILQEMEGIEIKTAKVDAPALYQDDVIYIGKDYLDFVCEWMILHEYVHALAEITNGGIENEAYAYNVFNETLTDIITSTMEPEIPDEYMSGYMEYYDVILLYIGCFKELSISSYFYGYDEIIEKVGKDEMDFFVNSIENMYSSEIALVCVNNFINKWAQQ